MTEEILFFTCFSVFILGMISLDLGVFNKKVHVPSFKESTIWTSVWIALSIAFLFLLQNFGSWLHGPQNLEELQDLVLKYRHAVPMEGLTFEQALAKYQGQLSAEYLAGYLLEYALSIDNIFVILLIFRAFKIERKYYHSVLFWGIIGALFFRFLFIFIGATLVARFEWILYVFGVFLVYTGVQMFRHQPNEGMDVTRHWLVKWISGHIPIQHDYKGPKFFLVERSGLLITPLFLALVVVEVSDVIFAVDSIPAIFGVTRDPYIVFFSNVFAILGLRSLFFMLENLIFRFRYLHYGLSIILVYIGIKMLLPILTFIPGAVHLGHFLHGNVYISLGIIGGILTLSLLLSWFISARELKARGA